MFTGIIETLGTVQEIKREGSNIHISIKSNISKELKIDQSISHNGVCLTIVAQNADTHTVTAIDETMQRSNFKNLKTGDIINLERAMLPTTRLDGHIVQGHVDNTGVCIGIDDKEGSWVFTFRYHSTPQLILVDKGSICVNGVSLTVVKPENDIFSVAIIPYTFEHTNFKNIQVGDIVNLEFDIIGKYIARYMEVYILN
jgi:riboflavin synthase